MTTESTSESRAADGGELKRIVRETFGYLPTDWSAAEAAADNSSTWPGWLVWFQRVEAGLVRTLLEQMAEKGEKRLPPLWQLKRRYSEAAGKGRTASTGPHCSECSYTTQPEGQAVRTHYAGMVPVVCDCARGQVPITQEYSLSERSRPALLWFACRCWRGREWFVAPGKASDAQWKARMRVPGNEADAFLRQCIDAVDRAAGRTVTPVDIQSEIGAMIAQWARVASPPPERLEGEVWA